MENKGLREIRFQIFGGNQKQRHRLRNLASHIAFLYHSKIENFIIPYTYILVIGFNGSKNEEYFYLGNKNGDKIGGTGCYFSFEYFLELDEEGKKNYVLQRIHYIIVKFAMHFNIFVYQLEIAFKKVIEDSFYTKYSKVHFSKENKYLSFWLEVVYDYECLNYRLVYNLKSDKKLNYLNICTKEYFFGVEHPEMDFEEIMNTPMYLKEKGWIDDKNFEMAWGEEKYIFNTDELAIKFFPG